MSEIRRTFLAQLAGGALASGASAARAADPAKAIPTIRFGNASITRLIIGGNPLGGYSHSTRKLDDIMRHYFTVQRAADLLIHAEEQGITTFQSHYAPLVRDAINRAREQGSKIQWLCLASWDDPIADILALKPLGIAHHGNRTDYSFQSRKPYPPEKVRDFVKLIKDKGVMAGVSTHSPQVFARIEDSGWENDYYMACLYYITRTPEELKGIYGDTLVNEKEEPFVTGDPARMCARIRATKKPVLAFKLLAAGRSCWSEDHVENAFRFAYANIKPIDACIVGMFPILSDEVRANADLARKYAALKA